MLVLTAADLNVEAQTVHIRHERTPPEEEFEELAALIGELDVRQWKNEKLRAVPDGHTYSFEYFDGQKIWYSRSNDCPSPESAEHRLGLRLYELSRILEHHSEPDRVESFRLNWTESR